MNSQHSVKQIAVNIWRVDRWNGEKGNRESLFITEPAGEFFPDAAYSCTISPEGFCRFSLDGKEVLSEISSPFTQSFAIGEKDGIYGLGIHQHQPLNRRGMVCQMLQINGNVTAVPFFTSTGGYAVLIDSCAYMSIGIDKPCTTECLDEYETDETDPNRIHIYADDADIFTYYVILGRTMDEQIAGYRLLTGKSPMFARWTYGFFQSREHYKTQEELLSIAHEFRSRHIPLDCIVQDWNYWGDLGWNALEWDEKKYPDPKGMIDELHGMNLKLMISVWPSFGPQTAVCAELEQAGGILEKPERQGENWGRVHDPLNPAAADIIWKYMDKNLFSNGVDAWWLDSTEPAFESDNSRNLLQCTPCAKGSNRRYLNCLALNSSRNVYRHQRAKTDSKRVYILTRSGYAGQQACGASTWTGDIKATWPVFKEQLSSLLSFSASGIPYSTTDIGAFFVEIPEGSANPEYRELYTRWFWFGAFSPIFRSHGTSTPREMWFFGEPGTAYFDAQMAASRLRYALMPYIYASAFRVYRDDATMMRPLVMDFPTDEKVRDISDSYLFGDSLLVHIITDPGIQEAEVYLPAGADWVDFWDGKRYAGGQTVTVAAPLDRIPLFARAGSMVLTTEPAECTARQPETTVQLRIFTGADCKTIYYKDDGDNYSYESGNYACVPFAWEEASRTLIIGAPEGKTGFALPERVEIYLDNQYSRTVEYRGENVSVSL